MGLAMMVGRCWGNALSTVPGYKPILESAVTLVGARDFDPWELRDLKASDITTLAVESIHANGVRAVFEPLLKRLSREVDHVYLHIDMDVYDPKVAPANYYNAPGGLSSGDVREAIALIGQYVDVAGGGISSYDPSYDPDGKTAAVAVGVLESLAAASR
jgi:arginase